MSITSPHPSQGTAPQSATPSASSPFQEFCQREMKYHRAMAAMYEWLQAQEVLGIHAEFDGAFESIFIAGLEALAGQNPKPT